MCQIKMICWTDLNCCWGDTTRNTIHNSSSPRETSQQIMNDGDKSLAWSEACNFRCRLILTSHIAHISLFMIWSAAEDDSFSENWELRATQGISCVHFGHYLVSQIFGNFCQKLAMSHFFHFLHVFFRLRMTDVVGRHEQEKRERKGNKWYENR